MIASEYPFEGLKYETTFCLFPSHIFKVPVVSEHTHLSKSSVG